MKKIILLPKLAFVGIRKNSATYVPYIIAGMFSVFLFFAFSSIIHNELMTTLPHSSYLVILMSIGLTLLGLILIPFLLYTNSFLIKRRKMELGLYNILGLGKKHIAVMMLFETLMIFVMVFAGGIVLGTVFSKLLFLILLNLAGMSVNTDFAFSLIAIKQTFFYFSGAYLLNLCVNLYQVYKSSPNDLLKGSKKGEREPRRSWLTALMGVVFIGLGYYIAINTKVDTYIFSNFFFAVALVCFGTHFFFKAGVFVLLKILKGNKKFYYHKNNYATVSGMLYRMKKSASSLANICIFSTMIIITLLCTFSLWKGTEGILSYQYPFDVVLEYNSAEIEGREVLDNKLQELSTRTNTTAEKKIEFTCYRLPASKTAEGFRKRLETDLPRDRVIINLIELKDYNKIEHENEKLEENEVLIFTTGSDLGFEYALFENNKYFVKRKPDSAVFDIKVTEQHFFGDRYYVVVKDMGAVKKISAQVGNADLEGVYSVRLGLKGEDRGKKEFSDQIIKWCLNQKGFKFYENGITGKEETVSMNGGLLFLGIFFGIAFSICLIIIMYYKQITEGFDDRENFSIMQKVGMSDMEVRGTIRKQILLVFFLPFMFAILHTLAGFSMISQLLAILFLFDKTLLLVVAIAVAGIFVILYFLSYILTSKAYYRIVRQMS